MFWSEEHSSKRIFLINLTEFGIKILIRDEHLKKHFLPMFSIWSCKRMDERDEQQLKQ
jgi:hypothetical protein